MCYNSCPWFEPWIERCRKPRGERCCEEDDNGDDSHPGIQPA